MVQAQRDGEIRHGDPKEVPDLGVWKQLRRDDRKAVPIEADLLGAVERSTGRRVQNFSDVHGDSLSDVRFEASEALLVVRIEPAAKPPFRDDLRSVIRDVARDLDLPVSLAEVRDLAA